MESRQDCRDGHEEFGDSQHQREKVHFSTVLAGWHSWLLKEPACRAHLLHLHRIAVRFTSEKPIQVPALVWR